MGMTKDFQIPRELAPFRQRLQQTIMPTSRIIPINTDTSLYDSKFGGDPYLPNTRHYPKDSSGQYMKLLAQINCRDFQLSLFPTEGMLQFFIPSTTEFHCYESHEEIWQQNFKVRYYEKLVPAEQLTTDFSFINAHNPMQFPIQQELKLHFEVEEEIVSIMDYRFYDTFDTPLSLLFNGDGNNLYDIYMKHFLGQGHKVGGYPYFTKQDPRQRFPFLKKYDVLLLQIESNDEDGIMWGDCGVANFFINRDDLLRRDFSDILYHWDHYE